MTIPATTRLRQIDHDVRWLLANLPRAAAALEAAMPDGWGSGGGDGGRPSGGEVSRPTEAMALAGLGAGTTLTNLEHASVSAAAALRRMVELARSVPDPVVDTSREADRARCTGGIGEWADPTCTNLGVRRYRLEDGVEHELCDPCRRRYHRHTAPDARIDT